MSGTTFWHMLPKPILALAPMADVTDAPFRQIIAKYSKPGAPFVFFTEFTSADGLMHPTGREKLMRELYFTPTEKPIVAQLFSARPEKMFEAAKLVASLGFDGVDINMGCPDKNIEKQGCGASLIKNHNLAKELIIAAKEGSSLPVSVKTRIGYNKIEIDSWLPSLLEAKPTLITTHLRTRKEMSKVPAHWELMPEIKKIVAGSGTLLLGNGDVESITDAKTKTEQYNIDGVMLGRAIYGNPWLFANSVQPKDGYRIERPELALARRDNIPSPRERLHVLLEHAELFNEMFGETETNQKLFKGHTKSFAIMKKHFKAYVEGFPGAHELRAQLMETENVGQVQTLITNFLQSHLV